MRPVAPCHARGTILPKAWLSHAIERVTGKTGIRERAAALGEQVRSEDGTGTAVRLIDDYLARQ